jgi:carbamoyl-phosphate synthase large subunit
MGMIPKPVEGMIVMTPPFKCQKVLVIGAGPDVIGQGPELNGAVWQVCRFLQAEAIKVVLIDSNLSSVATDLKTVARTYIEPLTVATLEQIIAKEKPDSILPVWGGRTALNLLTGLAERNLLAKYHLKVLGVDPEQLAAADRLTELRETLAAAGFRVNPGAVVRNPKEGLDLVLKVGLPVMLRPIGTGAGAGAGIVYNREEFGDALARAFDFSPVKQVRIEEALEGWFEYELVVLRDATGQCLVVSSLEYLGATGVHAEDRLKIIPARSLAAPDYQWLTVAAAQVLAQLQLVGGANLRFAQNPVTHEWVVTNINLRYTAVSALTALVSGCPVIRIWTKLLLGYSLTELFDPAVLDSGAVLGPESGYLGVALPCFAGRNQGAGDQQALGAAKQSIGEVIGLGGCFKEALQKAVRALHPDQGSLIGGEPGLVSAGLNSRALKVKLVNPDPLFLYYVSAALQNGMPAAEVARLSKLQPWVLAELAELIKFDKELTTYALYNLPVAVLRQAKTWGFSDRHLARLFLVGETQVRKTRQQHGVIPGYRRVRSADPAQTPPVWFSTYDASAPPLDATIQSILLVGSGPQRIGAGAELDYCQVHAANGVAALGSRCVLVNSNPYGVALGSPWCDRVYVEPLTGEEVLNLSAAPFCEGVLLDYAGEAGARLQADLTAAGIELCGNRAEVFGLLQDPACWERVLTQVGLNRAGVEQLAVDSLGLAVETIGDGEAAQITGIVEQIEEARINLNDSACSLPPYSLAPALIEQAGAAALQLTRILKIRGLFQSRFVVRQNRLAVLEARLGAGQLTPFICKATGRSWIEVATGAILGRTLTKQNLAAATKLSFTAVKEAVFPFNRFPSADPVLGGEVRSIGAALGMAQDFGMAFIKAQLAVGEQMPSAGVVYLKIRDEEQRAFIPLGKQLSELGFELIAPEETALVLQGFGLKCQTVNHIGTGRPDILDWIKNGKVQWLIGTPAPERDHQEETIVRQAAVARGIPITTTLAGALAAVQGMRQYLATGQVAKALQDYTYFAAINSDEKG